MLTNGPGISAVFSNLLGGNGQKLDSGDQSLNAQQVDFKELLSTEQNFGEIMSQLEELLPPQDFAALAQAMGGGEELPEAAILAADQELDIQQVLPEIGEMEGILPMNVLEPAAMPAVETGQAELGLPLSGASIPVAPSIHGFSRNPVNKGVTGTAAGAAVVPDSISGGGAVPGESLHPDRLPFADRLQPQEPVLVAAQPQSVLSSTAPVTVADPGSTTPMVAGLGMSSGGSQDFRMGSLAPSSQASLDLEIPFGAKNWGQSVGDRVLWMVGQNVQGASLRITPPNLGTVEIQVTMQNDQASINFTAQNAAVKEALEAALPRLREMFNETNLQLANVDVSHRESQHQRGMAGNSGGGAEADPEAGPGQDNAGLSGDGEGELPVSRQMDTIDGQSWDWYA
ncbi:MAG: hypothetical protein GY703_06430 [Gammaproteobacteria bacterium]|nr:hypothetical protein [Gammaproteobacteria bacterium]